MPKTVTKTTYPAQEVVDATLSRAIVKDARGGIRVDGVDLEATEANQVFYVLERGVERVLDERIQEVVKDLKTPFDKKSRWEQRELGKPSVERIRNKIRGIDRE